MNDIWLTETELRSQYYVTRISLRFRWELSPCGSWWHIVPQSNLVQSIPITLWYRWYFYIQQTDRLTYKRGGGNFRGSLSPGIVYQTDILYHSNIPSCHNMLHLLMSLNKKKKTLNGALKSPAIKWDVINRHLSCYCSWQMSPPLDVLSRWQQAY